MTFSDDLMDVMARLDLDDLWPWPDGKARQALWTCEDGWVVGYTTTRIQGGPHSGKFTSMVYEPDGKGLRRAKWVPFSTRAEAKFSAQLYFYDHSPKAAKRHRWNGLDYS